MKKIKFKNGSEIKFHSVDEKDAGRASSPFIPHSCQEEEFAISQSLKKVK